MHVAACRTFVIRARQFMEAALLGCLLMACAAAPSGLFARDQALMGKRRDLSKLNLNGADMTQAQLVHADLSESTLVGANFQGNDLVSLRAVGANLDRANLSHTQLAWATLSGSSLVAANLFRSNLRHADLRGVDLADADLSGALLQNVHLMGTQLATARGLKPELVRQAACWDARTLWPAGWEIPTPLQACDLHGSSKNARDRAVQGTKVVDESRLLLREK